VLLQIIAGGAAVNPEAVLQLERIDRTAYHTFRLSPVAELATVISCFTGAGLASGRPQQGVRGTATYPRTPSSAVKTPRFQVTTRLYYIPGLPSVCASRASLAGVQFRGFLVRDKSKRAPVDSALVAAGLGPSRVCSGAAFRFAPVVRVDEPYACEL